MFYVIKQGQLENNHKMTLHFPGDCTLLEPSYPIVLDTTGDQISVGATGLGNTSTL